MKNPIPLAFRFWTTNISLALAAGYFAWVYGTSFIKNPRLDTLLLFVLEGLIVVFFLARNKSVSTSARVWDWIAAFGGTITPLFFRPVAFPVNTLAVLPVQVTGALVCIAAVSSLNTSFGLIPSLRGIKTSGLYSFIRHPMYLGYGLLWSSYILGNVSFPNLLVWGLSMIFIFLRIHNEEQFLSVENLYKTYIQKIRWRLVPYVY